MYKPGETIKLPTLARTLRADGRGRARGQGARAARAGIVAARDRFYKGDIAARDGRVPAEARRAVRRQRLRRVLRARSRSRRTTTYRGYTVYKHGFGSQGPVLLQTLNILEKFDLQRDGLRQRRLPAHGHRGDEARLRRPRHLLRRPGVRARARPKDCCRRSTRRSAPR